MIVKCKMYQDFVGFTIIQSKGKLQENTGKSVWLYRSQGKGCCKVEGR